MEKFSKRYEEIVTIPKLLSAWQGFQQGKKKRNDVLIFQNRLADNLLDLYRDLKGRNYQHGPYQAFNISDPKPRNIHKATVRDRLLHHLLYQGAYVYFDRRFIADSYSGRLNKGMHRANLRLAAFVRRLSRNDRRTVWALKGDVKKFFASIDHKILKNILKKHLADPDLLWLFDQVIDSFQTAGRDEVGLPLGNLTSQLLVNVYLNEFDQFIKHRLKIKYYLRYADDFVILSSDRDELATLRPRLEQFLRAKLRLELHPSKVFIKAIAGGVDFLGWVQFYDHRVLRTKTKRRMIKKITEKQAPETLASYFGMLKHGNAHRLEEDITNYYNTL